MKELALKPWHKVVTPREDLREGRPLDASEFAVHLDHVRDGRAPAVYQNPAEFFDRTFLTKNLRLLAGQVTRRLSGIRVETSAIFNLSTSLGAARRTRWRWCTTSREPGRLRRAGRASR